MTRSTFIFIVLLLPLNSIAQQDYIITTGGDTLTGKVIRGNLTNHRITIRNAEGRQRFHLREIKEWKNGYMPVMVVPHTGRKRMLWYELLLVTDGKKRLFRDLEYVRGYWIYYVEHDGKYMQLTRESIDNRLVPELLKCRAFAQQYGQRTIRQSDLEKVFEYYNQHCSKSGNNAGTITNPGQ